MLLVLTEIYKIFENNFFCKQWHKKLCKKKEEEEREREQRKIIDQCEI